MLARLLLFQVLARGNTRRWLVQEGKKVFLTAPNETTRELKVDGVACPTLARVYGWKGNGGRRWARRKERTSYLFGRFFQLKCNLNMWGGSRECGFGSG